MVKLQLPSDPFEMAVKLSQEVPADVLEEAIRLADLSEKEQDYRDEKAQAFRPL